MKKKNINEAVPPSPTAPAAATTPMPARNIGQDYAAAKKTISMMLNKLGTAFKEYESRMGELNMALQRKIVPLAAGQTGAMERISQLEKDYEELQRTSQEQLAAAEKTIKDLRTQLKDALSIGSVEGERLRLAQNEIKGLEQHVAAKTQVVEELMMRLEKAKDRIKQGAAAHDADRLGFAKAMDAYEAEVAKLKKANEELQATADEAIERFNTLLAGVTSGGTTGESTKLQAIMQKYRDYGSFDLHEHLAKAKKKQKKNAADW